MRRARALLGALALLAAAPAAAEGLVTSVSTHQVLITSKYAGTELVVFGVVARDRGTAPRAGPYDVVVRVRGPRAGLVVREKRRLGPIWTNRESRRYPDAPSFLAVIASRPLIEVAGEEARGRLGLGLLEAVRPAAPARGLNPEETPFRAALVRLQRERGLYVEDGRGVTFLTAELFRAPVRLPAAAPVGDYDVEVILMADGVAIARDATSFELVKSGIERQVAAAAEDSPLAYGLLAAGMAVLLGWAGHLAFRRD